MRRTTKVLLAAPLLLSLLPGCTGDPGSPNEPGCDVQATLAPDVVILGVGGMDTLTAMVALDGCGPDSVHFTSSHAEIASVRQITAVDVAPQFARVEAEVLAHRVGVAVIALRLDTILVSMASVEVR